MKAVTVLGCTGSIGTTTLEVLRALRRQEGDDAWTVRALSAGCRVDDLVSLARAWQPALVCVADAAAATVVGDRLPGVQVVHGAAGLCAAATAEADIVVNGLVGAIGLQPTLAALTAGRSVAMANKEPLVMAGGLLLEAGRAGGGRILPVDSEPSALWQCLHGERLEDVCRLWLTASGGAFRDRPRASLASVSPAEALDHPTWRMGPKITVDSATLMNKGFEVVEASWLFDLSVDRIDVVLHRESTVHAMVEFTDGAILAHLGRTDMALPIQYALTYPERRPGALSPLRLGQVGCLHFEEPDPEAFPALPLCYAAGRAGGTVPAALNAANEVAVAAFLDGRIGFLDIHEVNRTVLEAWVPGPAAQIESVLDADRRARQQAAQVVARHAHRAPRS